MTQREPHDDERLPQEPPAAQPAAEPGASTDTPGARPDARPDSSTVNESSSILEEPFTLEKPFTVEAEGGGGGGGQGQGQGQGGSADEAEVEDPVAQAERERDEYLDALRRERAEFDNFRKRATKERMDALDRGAEQLVVNLLGVLDSFGFALDAAEKSGDEQLHKGVEMVYAQLVDALTGAGVHRIDQVRVPFDPTVHEAMLQIEAVEVLGEDVDEPVVVEVLRPGYRFKDRVLRPASVKVAR